MKKLAALSLSACVAAYAQAQPPTPPAAPPPAACTRADLQAAVDGYVAAQKAGDDNGAIIRTQ